MIKSNLKNYNEYLINDKFKTAFSFLESAELSEMDEYINEIAFGVKVILQNYTTLCSRDLKFETHNKSIDLQYVITGAEHIELAHREQLTELISYNSTDDITFYNDPDSKSILHLSAGDFAIFFPYDGHKPRCSIESDCTWVKKVVIKISVD